MIDELDNAIHCYEGSSPYALCGRQFKQMAEWLKELKRLRTSERVTLWIARNDDDGTHGSINVFQHKPVVSKFGKYFVPCKEDICRSLLPQEGEFPSVTFENSPQKVELRLIKE